MKSCPRLRGSGGSRPIFPSDSSRTSQEDRSHGLSMHGRGCQYGGWWEEVGSWLALSLPPWMSHHHRKPDLGHEIKLVGCVSFSLSYAKDATTGGQGKALINPL